MWIRSLRGWVVVLGLCAGSLLGAPSAARAVVCSQAHFVEFDTLFTDCAGNQNLLSRLVDIAVLDHVQTSEGPHVGSDWFTDLHLTFTDPEVVELGDNTDQGEAYFVNNGVGSGVDWLTQGDLVDEVSFVAPTFGDRVDPGDLYTYRVDVYGDFSALTGLNVVVAYTMDVPEPAGAALLAGAGLALVAARRQRRR